MFLSGAGFVCKVNNCVPIRVEKGLLIYVERGSDTARIQMNRIGEDTM